MCVFPRVHQHKMAGNNNTEDDADDGDNNSDEAVEDADANADDDHRGRLACRGVRVCAPCGMARSI